MRRLPIYFLIDVSESMIGDPIQQVQEGIATIIKGLKTDPVALETVWISIIIFAGEAKTLVPLQDIISFYPPNFPVGSGTSLSKGLGHLMHELRQNIVTTTAETKGDWKPIIFLLTDGVPTDDTSKSIQEWNSKWKRRTNLVSISVGNGADLSVLGKLSEHVLKLENTDSSSFKDFIAWVTDSIKANSENIDAKSSFELAKSNSDNLSTIDISKESNKNFIDDNFVVLSGLCQNTRKTYLMKYERKVNPTSIGGMDFSTKSYKLNGAFLVDNTYNELSDEKKLNLTVNTEELTGVPTCPSCGNQTAFAVCQCGQIHCVGTEDVSKCPGCSNMGRYGFGDGGFDVNRTLG